MDAEFAPSADGRLPASLAITSTPVDATISPNDAMAVADVPGYLAEALWANHQDVVTPLRRPIDPNAADRPFT